MIQIIAGLPPEVAPFDAANQSPTGWAWEPGFAAPNLAWWDYADRRILSLVDEGLTPCIFGSWGYYLSMMDTRQLVRHWREMIARWGAYPVVWCLAGEPSLLFYDEIQTVLADIMSGAQERGESVSPEEMMAAVGPHAQKQLVALNTLANVVRHQLDSFGRLLTIHTDAGAKPWELVADESLLDFWMLQTGHFGYPTVTASVDGLNAAIAREPRKPAIVGEVNYEGIATSSYHDIQRFLFWSHLLSGAAGHSYGAHGVWAMNTSEFPGQYSGLAPAWTDAIGLPGATHQGQGAQLLRSLNWQTLRAAPELLSNTQNDENRHAPYSAELADGTRLVYVPSLGMTKFVQPLRFTQLGGRAWSARRIELYTGAEHPTVTLHPDSDDSAGFDASWFWSLPSWGDWLIILKAGAEERTPHREVGGTLSCGVPASRKRGNVEPEATLTPRAATATLLPRIRMSLRSNRRRGARSGRANPRPG